MSFVESIKKDFEFIARNIKLSPLLSRQSYSCYHFSRVKKNSYIVVTLLRDPSEERIPPSRDSRIQQISNKVKCLHVSPLEVTVPG